MCVLNSVEAVADLLLLAAEIEREERIPFKAAVIRAAVEPSS